MQVVQWFEWRDLIDIGLSALLLYGLLASARSARSLFMVLALAVGALAYAVARTQGFVLSARVLLAMLLGGVAYAVLMSHEDLRRWLDRVVGLVLNRTNTGTGHAVQTLVQAVQRMAAEKTGALIVLPGAQPLGADVHGGITLDAELSVPLVLSLFDPTSPGHDGALVVRDNRAAEFAVHLPLSTNAKALGERGTRHAAALGLAEQTDALCVVVSEECGHVSIAKRGELTAVDTPELTEALDHHLTGRQIARPRASHRARPGLQLVHAAVALMAATVGWFATVQGNREVTRTIEVPVSLEGLPENYELRASDPANVEVTLSGPRSELMLVSDRDVELSIDGWSAVHGRRTFFVEPRDVHVGPGLEVRSVQPRRVRVDVETPEEIAGRRGQ